MIDTALRPDWEGLWRIRRIETPRLTLSMFLRECRGPLFKSFLSMGRCGDTLASLPVVRAMGGATVLLRCHTFFPVDAALSLIPLLEVQSYILGARFYNEGESVFWSDTPWVDRMHRDRRRGGQDWRRKFLCEWHLDLAGLPYSHFARPWLTVPAPAPKEPLIFCRTARYHGAPELVACWKKALAAASGRCAFIGTAAEHRQFEHDVGAILWHPTRTLLDAAAVIAGARYVVTNQSGLFWVTAGLGVPHFIEPAAEQPNCQSPALRQQRPITDPWMSQTLKRLS